MATQTPVGGVTEIKSQAEFDKALQDAGGKLVVVDFFATWCGPCKMIAPKIASWAASEDYKGAVIFLKVDVDEAEDLAEHCKVSAMPTFHFYKNAEKVAEVVGANEQKIKEEIDARK